MSGWAAKEFQRVARDLDRLAWWVRGATRSNAAYKTDPCCDLFPECSHVLALLDHIESDDAKENV